MEANAQNPGPERARGDRARQLLTALGGVALGYALGLLSAPRAPAPDAGPAPEIARAENGGRESGASTPAPSPESAPPTPPPSSPPPAPSPPPGPDAGETLRRIGTLDDELQGLARALEQPHGYRTARGVLDDLAAYEAARTRREALARLLPDERRTALAPPAELPAGLRERARAIERAGALGLAVRGAPADVSYLPVSAPSPDGRGAEITTFAGVALGVDPAGPRVVWRTLRGDVERRVSILPDTRTARDVLRVEYCEKDGPVRVSRASEIGPAGQTWRRFSERLWTRGSIEHDELEGLVAAPLAHPPRPGWIDWLRRHVDLPRNRDLGEEYGPAAPLPRRNPLLLANERARPAVLERGDLVVDPERREPPVAVTGRGPFVLIAANAIGVYDAAWRWLVFDTAGRRVVDHAELAAGEVEHVRWDFLPEPERFPQARRGDLVDALLATALERTRQALAIVSLPGEISALGQELRSKVGGVLSQDGLDALRLRDAVLDRMRRLDAIAHLLLDDDGVVHYEMAHDKAKLETTSEVVEVIARMIDDGHEGPAEYLLRDDRVMSLLFHSPATKSDRERLRLAFRARFRPWSVRLRRSLSGLPTEWYEQDS